MKNRLSGRPLSILLVEDNLAHAELVKRSFEEHRVANALTHLTDGEQALNYLMRKGKYAEDPSIPHPHIILLDLRLPRIDGLDLLEMIRSAEDEELRRIPVVILTTSEAEQDVVKAYERHANSYIVKPLDFDGFTTLMDDLGFYWLGWNYYPWSREKV